MLILAPEWRDKAFKFALLLYTGELQCIARLGICQKKLFIKVYFSMLQYVFVPTANMYLSQQENWFVLYERVGIEICRRKNCISNCICLTCNMYFSQQQNVFVPTAKLICPHLGICAKNCISNCICPSCNMYLFQLQICICPNCKINLSTARELQCIARDGICQNQFLSRRPCKGRQ